MGKMIFLILWTVFCIAVAVSPEIAMLVSWHNIQPTSESARLITVIAFWAFGGGFCLLMPFIAVFMWAAICSVVL